MTKSTGIGRGVGGGGKKPGAGRKPKGAAKIAKQPKIRAAAESYIEILMRTSDGLASALVGKAFATMVDVMDNSPTSAPRVSAARAIIELAKEEMLATAGGKLGKKEEQALAAVKAGAGTDWGDDLQAPPARAN